MKGNCQFMEERLPKLLQGHSKENTWNFNEIAGLCRALSGNGFGERGSQCKTQNSK